MRGTGSHPVPLPTALPRVGAREKPRVTHTHLFSLLRAGPEPESTRSGSGSTGKGRGEPRQESVMERGQGPGLDGVTGQDLEDS